MTEHVTCIEIIQSNEEILGRHFSNELISCIIATVLIFFKLSVRLWDMSTHTNKVCYKGHNAPIWDLDVG